MGPSGSRPWEAALPAKIIEAAGACGPDRLAELAELLEKSLGGFPPQLAEPRSRRDYVAKFGALADIAEYRESGALAGAIAVYANDLASRRAFITYVAVDPAFRGRGIARELLAAVLEHLKAKGFASVFLRVRTANATARRLYAEAGFRLTQEAGDEVELSAALEGRP